MKLFSLIGRGVKSFVVFWYEFIVGEDVTIAISVVIGLALTYALHRAGAVAWWALGVCWVLALFGSLMRVVRKARVSQQQA